MDWFAFGASIKTISSNIWHSTARAIALDLGVIGLPFSIIISRDKKDIARLIGPIDWSKKEIEDLFLELIKK